MTDRSELIAKLKDLYPWTKEAAELWEIDLHRIEALENQLRRATLVQMEVLKELKASEK